MAACRGFCGTVAALILFGGCSAVSADEFETCSVDLVLDHASGAPGAEVTGSGTPLTNPRDTVVELGGVPAVVTDVTRSDACIDCDTCRDDAGCAPCGLCSGIDLAQSERIGCFGNPLDGTVGSCDQCVQTFAFEVPVMDPGPTKLVLVNRNGQSASIPFDVLPAPATTTP